MAADHASLKPHQQLEAVQHDPVALAEIEAMANFTPLQRLMLYLEGRAESLSTEQRRHLTILQFVTQYTRYDAAHPTPWRWCTSSRRFSNPCTIVTLLTDDCSAAFASGWKRERTATVPRMLTELQDFLSAGPRW